MSAVTYATAQILRVLPRQRIGQAIGRLADSPWPAPVGRAVVGLYSRVYDIALDEYVEGAGTRADGRASTPSSPAKLRDGARAIDGDPRAVLSPADGRIESMARIEDGGTFLVKGRRYAVDELVGDAQRSAAPSRGRGLRRLPLAARLPPRARARGRPDPAHPVDARGLLPGQLDRHAPRRQPLLPQPPRGHRDRRRRRPRARHGRDGRRDDRRTHHHDRERRARRPLRRPHVRSAPARRARRRARRLSPGVDRRRARRAEPERSGRVARLRGAASATGRRSSGFRATASAGNGRSRRTNGDAG